MSKPRSQFVTALAWFSIVVAALMTCSSLLQTIFVNLFLPANSLQQLQSAADANVVPPALMFVVKHLKTILFVYLLLSLSLLAVSIALLKRKEWARIAFIVMLALGTLSGFAPLFLPFSISDFLPQNIDGLDVDVTMDAALGFQILTIGLTLLFAALHGWIIYKLCTSEIRSEFS
jgi:hypothetical protein